MTDSLDRVRIVLCRPSHPGNIGAAARAMKTMGVSDLRLVQPERFPAYDTGREAARRGGTAPAMFNAANEVAVQLFLEEQIPFVKIADILEQVIDKAEPGDATTLSGVLAADTAARRLAREAACS